MTKDFTFQKTLFKRKTKDILLQGGWIMKWIILNDAKFEGNILVVGRRGCSKMTFVQNLGKSKMFGEIKEVTCLSKIPLS